MPRGQALDPPQRRRRTLDAVKRLLLRESQDQPLLLVFEDLHWIDSETQALLDGLVESLPDGARAPAGQLRPEYQHGWGSKTYYTQLRLDPLRAESADELLEALVGRGRRAQRAQAHCSSSERRAIRSSSRRASGRWWRPECSSGERGAYRLASRSTEHPGPGDGPGDPGRAHRPLPPEEKRLLQTAAVIGKDVPFALLQAIADEPDEELRRGLAHLQAAEFLYETSIFPDSEYTFKHALTHEVAYGSLLHERRRALHAADRRRPSSRLYPDRLAEHVERLAHHASAGRAWDKAVSLSSAGRRQGAARSAHPEAVGLVRAGPGVRWRDLPETRHDRAGASTSAIRACGTRSGRSAS